MELSLLRNAARVRDPLRETGYRSQSLFAPQGFLPSCSHLFEEFTKDDTENNELRISRCHIAIPTLVEGGFI